MAKSSNQKFEHRSIWLGLSIGGALAIVIGVLWFIFSMASLVLERPTQPWVAALVIIVLGMLSVLVGDTVLMKQELED